MARDDDPDRPAPRPRHAVGEPLDALSVDELRLRIALLEAEIARLDAEIGSKQASRSAADAVFKR
ncbi:DUF1192 domain-containing protein [Lichenibacterium minor]|jgi:uncharacterized small protein (DUF1192 family)|uniref:DUF1192 domain-containing protein n=1 Tax=Lichenibacterium minor TaxID=2316528 RepID=A0A4Q2U123_9HYPH|nr:DUF1192 domain-containing protein [Lichenibacterium minor]RYC30133.1 DUF1192 domain-containing protein [Lichenibacterium minor]